MAKVSRTQNNCRFYHYVNREIPKECRTTFYKICFKPVQTYNAETWTLTKRNERNLKNEYEICVKY
jgi:hypothetical protein